MTEPSLTPYLIEEVDRIIAEVDAADPRTVPARWAPWIEKTRATMVAIEAVLVNLERAQNTVEALGALGMLRNLDVQVSRKQTNEAFQLVPEGGLDHLQRVALMEYARKVGVAFAKNLSTQLLAQSVLKHLREALCETPTRTLVHTEDGSTALGVVCHTTSSFHPGQNPWIARFFRGVPHGRYFGTQWCESVAEGVAFLRKNHQPVLAAVET